MPGGVAGEGRGRWRWVDPVGPEHRRLGVDQGSSGPALSCHCEWSTVSLRGGREVDHEHFSHDSGCPDTGGHVPGTPRRNVMAQGGREPPAGHGVPRLTRGQLKVFFGPKRRDDEGMDEGTIGDRANLHARPGRTASEGHFDSDTIVPLGSVSLEEEREADNG